MKALVIVESLFGNTRAVADAIARGLAGSMAVETVDVADAPAALHDVDLLVIGGPTHALGLTSPASRRAAADQSGGTLGVPETGLRERMKELPPGAGIALATFDTRMGWFWLPGSAASKAARMLRRRGYRLVDRPQSFRVAGTSGPLTDGEAARAERWGADLGARFAALPRGAER